MADRVAALLDVEALMASYEPVLAPRRPAWHADAACQEHPVELFFPERRPGAALSVVAAQARAVCAACLVRAECDAWATAQGPDLDGMWAGRTPHERRQLRRRRTAA